MIVLDTSSLVELTKGNSAIKEIVVLAEKEGEEVAISTVTSFELLQYVLHRKLTSHERIIRGLVASSTLLSFDADAAGEAAKIMGNLLRVGKPVNALDVMIAGCASASGAKKLISFDEDFSTIGEACDLVVQILRPEKAG